MGRSKRSAAPNGGVVLDHATHTYTQDGVRIPLCVTDVLALSGITKPYPEEAMYNMERARHLGERVHQWAAWMDEEDRPDPGELDVLTGTRILPFLLAYQRYREDFRPEWSHIEHSFVRDDVAGTPDRIGRIETPEGRISAIVDLKTAADPQPYWPIQLTGYWWLLDSDPSWNLYVIHLHRDGTYKPLNYSNHTEIWEAALTIAKWQIL